MATHLDRVVACGHASVLYFDIGGRMCEFTLGVRPGALVALELAAHLQLQPARVLAVQQVVDVDDGHGPGSGYRRRDRGRSYRDGRSAGQGTGYHEGHDFDGFTEMVRRRIGRRLVDEGGGRRRVAAAASARSPPGCCRCWRNSQTILELLPDVLCAPMCFLALSHQPHAHM